MAEMATFTDDELFDQSIAAPFPPLTLMQRVSGLTRNADFAAHGRVMFSALEKASPQPLFSYRDIFDFGVGSGRLARMFSGFTGRYVGADIDHELLEWVGQYLPWVMPLPTTARVPLPCLDGSSDCVISVSVFTHMNREDCLFYLGELRRITRPGAILLLTVHGERALVRAEQERSIFEMLSIPQSGITCARRAIDQGGFEFIRQNGHLTTASYDMVLPSPASDTLRIDGHNF
jgi:SAM-dependent methyltransferase